MNRVGEEHEGSLKGNRERRFLLLSEHHNQKPQNRKDYFICQLSDHPEAKSGPELK